MSCLTSEPAKHGARLARLPSRATLATTSVPRAVLRWPTGRPERDVPKMPSARPDLLGAAAEAALCRAARAGDAAAEATLVAANSGLVHALARRYAAAALPYEDAVQEGFLGLLTAIRRFNPDLGFKLSTFATHWIVQHLNRACDNQTRTIRLPTHVNERVRKLERAEVTLRAQLGREPTDAELLAELGWTARELARLREVPQQPLSLDAGPSYVEDDTLADTVADERTTAAVAGLATEVERGAALTALLAALPARDADLLRRRFGLPPYDVPQSLAEVAALTGGSREGVRQREVRAIRRARAVVLELGIAVEDIID